MSEKEREREREKNEMGIHHFGAVITFDHRKLRGQKREDKIVNEDFRWNVPVHERMFSVKSIRS